MLISELYKKNKKTLSFEVLPPKTVNELNDMDNLLTELCDLDPDFISIVSTGGTPTDNPAIALARKIKNEYHVEPLVHQTCLYCSKAEMEAFALAFSRAGIHNILALRGDRQPDLPERNDFQHGSDLITFLKQKREFCIAGACYPECHPESKDRVSELKHLRKKVDSGADLLLSQFFFDNDIFFHFLQDCQIADIHLPVIPGILPVVNAALSRKMLEICNASFSDTVQRMTEKYGADKNAMFDAGVAFAVSQIIDLLTKDIAGIHLYTLNNAEAARAICHHLRNIPFL